MTVTVRMTVGMRVGTLVGKMPTRSTQQTASVGLRVGKGALGRFARTHPTAQTLARLGFRLQALADEMAALATAITSGILPRVGITAIFRQLVTHAAHIARTRLGLGQRIAKERQLVFGMGEGTLQTLQTEISHFTLGLFVLIFTRSPLAFHNLETIIALITLVFALFFFFVVFFVLALLLLLVFMMRDRLSPRSGCCC